MPPALILIFLVGFVAGFVTRNAQQKPDLAKMTSQEKIALAQKEFLGETARRIEDVRNEECEGRGRDKMGQITGQLDWRDVARRLPGLLEAVSMYMALIDPKTPMRPKAIIAAALLYVLSPIDVIPDSIPVLGQIDDTGVILQAFREVKGTVTPVHEKKAVAWLKEHGIDPKPIIDIQIIEGPSKPA